MIIVDENRHISFRQEGRRKVKRESSTGMDSSGSSKIVFYRTGRESGPKSKFINQLIEENDMQKKALIPFLVLAMLLVSVGVVFAAASASFGASQPTYPTSFEGIEPTEYPGNFVSSDDDQVCYDMSALGYIGEVTGEMRGFKVDPPTAYNDGNIDVILSGDGKYLAWATEPNATVLAFIVKGGPNYHVYDYVGSGLDADSWLASPLNRRNIPGISHYNGCYTVTPDDFEGCTPGYWRNHADRWVGVAPGDDFDTIFGVDLFDPDITLGTAIWLGGGGNNAFARHATAALLNAYAKELGSNDQFVNFPYTVDEVIQMVQDAVANGTIEATKDLFEAANELGCPLSGTPADPV
jgi:hypothetical protein